jgi:cytochrome c peroxidase
VFDRKGTRRVPKLVNRGYGKSFFWDGRIPTLEEQVVQPILNELEMDMTIEESVERLRGKADYPSAFRNAFDRELNGDDLARALASYVRTIVSGSSRYDQYVAGDRSALDETERMGLEIFRGKGDCTLCHLGPNLTDEQFHNTGISWRDGKFTDQGRFTVTKNEPDRGAFKTPTLREAARSAPYMHDGSLATLEDVIEFYDKGGGRNPNLDREIQELRLTAKEKAALAGFLRTLNGTVRAGL